MAEEEVVVVASVDVPDLKRKLVDFEEGQDATSVEVVQPSVGSEEMDAKRTRVDANEEPEKIEKENSIGEGHENVKEELVVSGDHANENHNANNGDNQEDQPKVEIVSRNDDDDAPTVVNTTEEHNVTAPPQEPENEVSDIKLGDNKDSIISNEEVIPSQVNVEPTNDDGITSRKVEIPNDKVGVLIGKGGETIRYIQFNSDAKIQIMRDAETDLHSVNRPVEIVGKLSSILRAEKLINAVIAEAEAGGSPALVARGISTGQASGLGEHIEMKVPNDKVGLIIGRRGENIKNLQGRSGAHIQLIPQHLPDGDTSKERTVRVTGDRRQIEVAREMILDVMNQTMRPFSSGGYNQQNMYGHSGGGGGGPPYWGQRPPHSSHPIPYDYPQRGMYQSANSHYGPPSYGGGYPMQMPPRPSMAPGWDQRPFSQGGGYDYYSGRAHSSSHGPSPMAPPYHANYNYGPSHGSNYGHQVPYEDPKYTTHYGSSYPPQQYAKQPSYDQQPLTYGGPRATQPGEVSYQAPAQQQYSYPAPTDLYNQTAATAAAGYSYGQAPATGSYASYPPSQQTYAEQPAANASTGGYQVNQDPSYAATSGVTYAAPNAAQVTYSQPPSTQISTQPATYEHAVASQQSGYGAPPSNQPATYAKPASPRPAFTQYDTSQVYSAPH